MYARLSKPSIYVDAEGNFTDRIRSIRECRNLRLEKLNVLIGANGSGKTNLISFFQLLSAAMQGEFQVFVAQRGAAHSFLHFGAKITQDIKANLQFQTENETCVYGCQLSYAASDMRSLYPFGENTAAVLRFFRDDHPRTYARVLETIRMIAPFFDTFILDALPNSPDHVMLYWRARGSDYEFGPHQLSGGTLRFIALATLLLQPAEFLPGIVIIDEPELGLHPYAIKILGSLIQDAANFTQIIVATQSAALVDQVDADDVIVADMVDGASQFKRQSREKLKEWLHAYTLSELWEKNVLGGRP